MFVSKRTEVFPDFLSEADETILGFALEVKRGRKELVLLQCSPQTVLEL